MTIKQTVKKYANRLKDITHIPSKEIEILIMHLLDKNVIWLHLNHNIEFTKEKELEKLVNLREKNYPLEYLTNKVSFYGEQFYINEGVLIPRPETEILIEKVLEVQKNDNCIYNVLEIGTGSGIISVMLALLIEDIKIIAVDINEKALQLAQQNAKKHGVEDKIEFRLSNLFENVLEDSFDLVVSNPPYIANSYKLPANVKHEPSNALFGGEIGDELLKKIITQCSKKDISYLMCEMGYDQKKPLEEYFKSFDLEYLDFYKDYENFDRGFVTKFKN
ncbi:MAG: peptide chain release factor N(5)-glutamine methyltransferase [Halarcobacter sp.]